MLDRCATTLSLLAALACGSSCGGDEPQVPADDRPAGSSCQASVQCVSGICIGGGRCPDGRTYQPFCGGDPCEAGDCPIGEKCITIESSDGAQQVCIPTRICP